MAQTALDQEPTAELRHSSHDLVMNPPVWLTQIVQVLKHLPAGTGGICDMLFEVLKYHVFRPSRNIAAQCPARQSMAQLVVEKCPRPRTRRPQERRFTCGNSLWILWDDRPFISHTRPGIASLGGTARIFEYGHSAAHHG